MTGQEASDLTHRVLERYLDAHAIPWEPIPVGPKRSADYLLKPGSSRITCEVKTLVGKNQFRSGGYDPCRPIVRKIKKARPQLHGSDDQPHCVVLHSQSFLDCLSPTTVASAAFGPGFVQYQPDHSIIDGSPPVLRFSRKSELPSHLQHLANATLSPACNRRISALVLLLEYGLSDRELAIWRQMLARQNGGEVIGPAENLRILEAQHDPLPRTVRYEGTTRVIVLDNPYARVALPDDVFCGDFDQRWGASGELYGARWLGRTLESLYNDGVPFQML
jgi:hypothetical protein